MVGPETTNSLQRPVWSQLCFTSSILSLSCICHLLLSANRNGDHLCLCPCGKTISFNFFAESPFIHLERMENVVETRLGDTVKIPVKFKGYPPPEAKW